MKKNFSRFTKRKHQPTSEPVAGSTGSDLTPREKEVLKGFAKDIAANSYKSIQLARLFHSFGYKKRGEKNLTHIRNILADQGIHPYPVFTKRTDWRATIRLYHFPVQRLGNLFSSEFDLEEFMANHKSYKSLGIKSVKRQYKPNGTKDKLDFLGVIREGEAYVALELKHQRGGKRAVEQLSRYRSHLKRAFPGKEINCILVTGIRGLATAQAIHGLTEEERRHFKWYLYNYDKERQSLSFEEVPYSLIRENLEGSPIR
jgi:hypothetical protein